MWSKKTIENFRRRLLGWYGLHRRELPWRANTNPYNIWISEIMLQQTQVKTVIPYYRRFLKRFPDIETLANAPETEVLKLWSGLGYYSRARNIHKAAKQIIASHGSFPEDFSDVLALPGIGRYTAGAICSIAFNQPYPIVDGNIRRVLTRLNGTTAGVKEKSFWEVMRSMVQGSEPSSFNQAMMELGALICVPENPRCAHCPVESLCKAKRLGIESSIPSARKRPTCRHLSIVFLVLEQNGKVLLSKAGEGDLIPGKWQIPWRSIPDQQSAEDTALSMCYEIIGFGAKLESCAPVRHSITNHQITGLIFYGRVDLYGRNGIRTKRPDYPASLMWVNRKSLKRFLTSSAYFKVLASIPN